MARAASFVAAAVLSLSACDLILNLDYQLREGSKCEVGGDWKCGPGLHCDPVNEVCVSNGGTGGTGGAGGSAGAGGAGSGGGGAPPLLPIRKVGAGAGHSCVLRAGGSARCWGRNVETAGGALGNGTMTSSNVPVIVAGLTDGEALDAGQNSCAIRSGGELICWGPNYAGVLGNGMMGGSATTPVSVMGLADVVQLSVGNPFSITGTLISHDCAVTGDGKAHCWGYGTGGQLGDGLSQNSAVPVEVVGIGDARTVGAGATHACAVHASGAVSCWGGNDMGQLGSPTAPHPSPTPVNVPMLGAAKDVSIGFGFTCVALEDGSAACWGRGMLGQLGDGDAVDSPVPVPVALTGVRQIAAGFQHACALHDDGTVSCWGDNSSAQMGNGTNTGTQPTPAQVAGIDGAVSLGVGLGHTCVLLANDDVWCWGSNLNGQLGNGNASPIYVPVQVTGL